MDRQTGLNQAVSILLWLCAVLSRYFWRSVMAIGCWVLFGSSPVFCQSPIAATKLPPIVPERERHFDMQHIDLDLSFDFALRQAKGKAVLKLTPLRPIASLLLDAAFLRIEKIEMVSTEGVRPLTFQYTGGDKDDNLSVELGRTFAEGEPMQISIEYQTTYQNESDPNSLGGSYGKGLRFFQPTSTEPRKRRQIWSMGMPGGNRYWFPGYDAPNDLRTCTMRLTVPQPLLALAPGRLVGRESNEAGTETFIWQMETPHANHQSALVVGEYQPFIQQTSAPELIQYAFPDEIEATKATVVRLPDMVQFFEEITGHAYPYSAYGQVFVQEFPWGGGHNPGISTISENMVDDFGTHADFYYLWDGVEAQDLAAQWFGNLLTPKHWSEAWLNKSFALYFDCLYSEYKNGKDEMELWNRNFQINTCAWDWNSGIKRPLVTQHFADAAAMCQDNFALRGALVLHLLRHELGERIWRKAIQNYVKQYAGQLVTTADFQQTVEQAAERPMGWFFEQWLYRVGQPRFEITKEYNAKTGILTLTVEQVQQLDTSCAYPQMLYFGGKMGVEIDEQIAFVQLQPQAKQVLQFKVAKAPRWVHFDFGHCWIKEANAVQSLDELLAQYQYSQDALAQRDALIALTALYQKEETSKTDKQHILKTMRSVLGSNAYWRIRYQTILSFQTLLAGNLPDKATEALLLQIIKTEGSWNGAAAITLLGNTRDTKYTDLYLEQLNHASDRVVNAAANALGKCKSPKAFDALIKLKDKPSWKNQSLISALNGLRQLGDPRGAELALHALRDTASGARWFLGTATWDYRLAAAETLAALGKGEDGYPIVHERFVQALAENDINDIFSNLLLMHTLGCSKQLHGLLPDLRKRFEQQALALQALEVYESSDKN